MKTVVAAFNQAMALVGAFSVIVKTGTDGALHYTSVQPPPLLGHAGYPSPLYGVLKGFIQRRSPVTRRGGRIIFKHI